MGGGQPDTAEQKEDGGPGKEEAADGEAIESTEEEVLPNRAIRTPYQPSQSELEEHRIDHLPYRSWCPECVEGFGREHPHLSHKDKARWVPVISCDYLFLTARGVFTRKEWQPIEGEDFLKIMVIHDNISKALFAHAVPQKGVDEKNYIVDQFVNDILWLGYARVIVRSDNEPAIKKVVEDTLAALKVSGLDQAAAEGSVPYDPQTNGDAEAAVGVLKSSIRTYQLGLERQVQAKIPAGHPLMTWLVRHAAFARTLRVKGADGKTAYQRAKGRDTAGPRLVGFGEQCRFKSRAHEKGR